MLPSPIKNLIDLLTELPSIGPRQATRLAFHITNLGKAKIAEFARALQGLDAMKTCAQCFLVHQNMGALCAICESPKRRADIIAVVEKETDLVSIEKAGNFNGRYLVIGELTKGALLAPDQKLKLQHLKSLAKKLPGGTHEEIIIATNPTTYGDLSAAVIAQELKGAAKKISRLGRGIPTGGEIEFADEETLRQSLQHRD
ncbi:MAG: recombination protein RecR [Candidatus Harrisonbacteria bacterium]|nr:recombination protein RecR [Candidatus Harrisonbacteria bacterium]MBI2406367.1 recombination protein RecR [Candidatus Harrisonbacteria bacterium]